MMNFLRNMKKHFNLVLVIVLITGSIAICFCGCERDKTTEPKVQNETITEQPEYINLGEFRLTAYCGCKKCCGKWGENRPVDENGKLIVKTANGTVAIEGITVAADIDLLPYGTRIWIDGHEYTVQDCGSAINGNQIDVYFESHQEALEFGVQYKEIYIEKKG